MTKETDKVTKNFFKDFSCARHKFLMKNGICGNCLNNCDMCNDQETCQVCKVGFELNKEKNTCQACNVDEIYDPITKNCIKRVANSEKLVFQKFIKTEDGKKFCTSSTFKGPDGMGKMLVIQGSIFVKNYSAARHKMYELNTDPFYPDDNIQITLIINDIDMPASIITLRTDKTFVRDFYLAIPTPIASKLQLKFS